MEITFLPSKNKDKVSNNGRDKTFNEEYQNIKSKFTKESDVSIYVYIYNYLAT